MAKASKSPDPRQMAVDAVEKWFTGLLSTSDAVTDAGNQPTLESAFDEVTAALEFEHVAQHGPITPDQDVVMEMIGREAGYLIGVQVGLRLRAAR